jgi:hypothetical protein
MRNEESVMGDGVAGEEIELIPLTALVIMVVRTGFSA